MITIIIAISAGLGMAIVVTSLFSSMIQDCSEIQCAEDSGANQIPEITEQNPLYPEGDLLLLGALEFETTDAALYVQYRGIRMPHRATLKQIVDRLEEYVYGGLVSMHSDGVIRYYQITELGKALRQKIGKKEVV